MSLLHFDLFPVRPRRSLSFFCEEWLSMQRSRIKESSYAKYVSILQCHILPQLGGLSPSEIGTQTVEDFKNSLLESGLSAQSVKNILAVLRAVMSCAMSLHPDVLFTAKISYPKAPKKEPRVLSAAEQAEAVPVRLRSGGRSLPYPAPHLCYPLHGGGV